MHFFKDWALIICISTIAVSVLEMINISQKMTKVVHLVLGAFLLLAILTPLKNLKISSRSFNFKTSAASENLSDCIKAQSEELLKSNIKSLIQERLKEENIVVKKIKIFMDNTKDNCISISKAEIYIDKNLESRGEEIKNLVKRNFEINADIIISGSG